MSLNLEEKKAVVAEVSAEVAGAQTVVVAEYRGITVENMTQLRAQARKEGVYFKRLSVSSTMGVGVRVDQASVSA